MRKNFYKLRLIISLIIFILAILAILGIIYPVPVFDIQITPLLQRVITNFSIAALILFISMFIITIIFGRIYCSLVCPLGIFQEIICFIAKKKNKIQINYPLKYFIAAITLGTLIGGSTIIIKYLDPYTLFGAVITLSLTGIIAIFIISILTFTKSRIFCTNICPVGAILGLISKFSILKIFIEKDKCLSCSMCIRSCPSGCIDIEKKNINNETCVKCFKCITKCSQSAIKYGIKPKETIQFSIKRREIITAAAALIIFAGAIKTGTEILNKTAKRFKDIILPPGSVNQQRMFNKCLNCNLCINACPNKIIKKADEEFSAVHIDYAQGQKYCKYNCNECSRVCPSGAIKKISLEEKQKTRIAMAVINPNKCTRCMVCIAQCPVKAISKQQNGTCSIDSIKCIGCGACKQSCYYKAIEVFAVKEQKVL